MLSLRELVMVTPPRSGLSHRGRIARDTIRIALEKSTELEIKLATRLRLDYGSQRSRLATVIEIWLYLKAVKCRSGPVL